MMAILEMRRVHYIRYIPSMAWLQLQLQFCSR